MFKSFSRTGCNVVNIEKLQKTHCNYFNTAHKELIEKQNQLQYFRCMGVSIEQGNNFPKGLSGKLPISAM